MRFPAPALLLCLSVLACGDSPEGGDTAPVPADEPADQTLTDVEAVAAVADYYETHYNMAHPSMVASVMTEQGLMWTGTGARAFGREAIDALLTEQIEGSSPQIEVDQLDAMVFGDRAMSYGSYSVSGDANGQPYTNTGYWTSLFQSEGEDWKSMGLVSNLDSPDQVVLPVEMEAFPEPIESASMLEERARYYMTHFNLGHPSMVADMFTDDAVMMPSGAPLVRGRDVILERLTALTDAGAQVVLTPWANQELDGGAWIAGVGTYEIEVPGEETELGHYSGFFQVVDGEVMIHWLLLGAWPVE